MRNPTMPRALTLTLSRPTGEGTEVVVGSSSAIFTMQINNRPLSR